MADGWPGAVLGALLHGFHTADSGREWLVPVMLGSGMGAALVGRFLARRKAGGPRRRRFWDDDEPI